jgi:hypothetical protein
MPSLADRISVPIGIAARPFAALAGPGWVGRFVGGIGLSLGATLEHLRTSDADTTTGGLHIGASVELPVYGGAKQGGITLRVAGRVLFTPSVTLEANGSVAEPPVSGQLYAGICWYP